VIVQEQETVPGDQKEKAGNQIGTQTSLQTRMRQGDQDKTGLGHLIQERERTGTTIGTSKNQGTETEQDKR
jgi:hypothetical protein